MQLKFEMPEILIIFSLVMYPQSFWFSVAAFSLGLLARMSQVILDYGIEHKKAETIKESADELGQAMKDLFSVGDK
jgi:hypothetical protein